MEDDATSHAMTEIALALAMAFFCLLVLALVSMGQGRDPGEGTAVSTVQLGTASSAPEPPGPDDIVVLYADGRFLDPDGRRLDPNAIRPAGRVFLAIDPALSLTALMEVRERLADRDVRLTPMDTAWRTHLAPRSEEPTQ